MSENIKILILEHDPNDIDLVSRELKKGEFQFTTRVACNEREYTAALDEFKPDIILSDYSLPGYNGFAAYQHLCTKSAEVPFIFVSGTIGEERIIELIKNGVTDYVLKDKLFTLLPKIKRAINETREKREKKLAEEKLVRSEKYLRSIIENNADGIALLNMEMNVTFISPNCRNLLGYHPAELMGPFRADLIHPDDRKYVLSVFAQSIANPADSPLLQFRFLKKMGEYVWIEAKYSNHLDEHINAVILNYRDISEKKKNEDEIRKLNAELEERVRQRTAALLDANQQLESFSYSVSHDLRSPIRSIYGFTQILERRYKNNLDKEGEELLGVIRTSTAKMNTLVDELLAFSRLGAKNIARHEIDMNRLVQTVWENVTENVYPKPELIIHPVPAISGDEAMITQVLVNFISNAVKYSAKNTTARVEIGAYENGNEIVYFVRDNGAGFDMQYANKLFAIFQRLHEANEFEGTGVGLAIVKRIVERHGGRVWGEGKLDEGATFYFAMPKVLAETEKMME